MKTVDPNRLTTVQTEWTPEEDEELQRQYELNQNTGAHNGVGWTRISRALNRTENVCRVRMKNFRDHEKNLKSCRFESTEDLKIVELYNQGKSFKEIGDILNRHSQQIYTRYWRHLAGDFIDSKAAWDVEEDRQLLTLRAQVHSSSLMHVRSFSLFLMHYLD